MLHSKGFAPVDLGSLAAGRPFQQGGGRWEAPDLRLAD